MPSSKHPDTIARSAVEGRNLPLRALEFQTFNWDDCTRQLHIDEDSGDYAETLVALVKHGDIHTFFRLDVPLHMEIIEATYARTQSASSITIFGMEIAHA